MIRNYFPEDRNKIFIFGSSVKYKDFMDIDVGILGAVDDEKLAALDQELEQSTFPYIVDLKNFNTVGADFLDSVLHRQKIKWI